MRASDALPPAAGPHVFPRKVFMNRTRHGSLRQSSLTIVGLTVLLAVPDVGYSQSPWPAIQMGRISQGSPLTTESGWIAGIQVPVALSRGITVRPGFDFIRSHVNSSITPCYPVAGPQECLQRPDTESAVYGGAVFRAVLPSGRVRPFLEGGGAVGRSLNEENPGERRTFVGHHVGLGIHVPTGVGTWSVGAWWRGLDRWPEGLRTSRVLAIVAGFQPGGRR